jgi:hypothetical protein
MRGAQHIGQVEKGILHAELPRQKWFGLPGIDAKQKVGMALHMGVQGLLIEQRASSDIDQDRVWLHPPKLPFPNQSPGCAGEKEPLYAYQSIIFQYMDGAYSPVCRCSNVHQKLVEVSPDVADSASSPIESRCLCIPLQPHSAVFSAALRPDPACAQLLLKG